MVSDRIKETLSPAYLRHVLSTEGTEWFGPEKLTEVNDTYENSQMYLPGTCNYSKFSGTGSAKPRDKFVNDCNKTFRAPLTDHVISRMRRISYVF